MQARGLYPSDLAANMWVNTGEIPDNLIDDDGNGYVDDYHGWNFMAVRYPAEPAQTNDPWITMAMVRIAPA